MVKVTAPGPVVRRAALQRYSSVTRYEWLTHQRFRTRRKNLWMTLLKVIGRTWRGKEEVYRPYLFNSYFQDGEGDSCRHIHRGGGGQTDFCWGHTVVDKYQGMRISSDYHLRWLCGAIQQLLDRWPHISLLLLKDESLDCSFKIQWVIFFVQFLINSIRQTFLQGWGGDKHCLLPVDPQPVVHLVPGGAGLLVLPILPGQV